MKWSELLLILAAVRGSLSQNIEVSQIPEVNAIEGSTANLECSYNSNNLDLPIGWYKWYRHDLQGTDIFKSDDFKDRLTKESPEDFLKKRSASIQLHRVTGTDTGLYFCEVEFSGQEQIKGHGKGTFLNVTVTVTVSQSSSSCTDYIVFGALAMFSALLVSAYLGYLRVTKSGKYRICFLSMCLKISVYNIAQTCI
uniref:Natural cytotoxicity triggering receptor 3 n=1 Tax=Xenopus tropicalis TaxID=8364 RepID=A0A803JFC6_XENTR